MVSKTNKAVTDYPAQSMMAQIKKGQAKPPGLSLLPTFMPFGAASGRGKSLRQSATSAHFVEFMRLAEKSRSMMARVSFS